MQKKKGLETRELGRGEVGNLGQLSFMLRTRERTDMS